MITCTATLSDFFLFPSMFSSPSCSQAGRRGGELLTKCECSVPKICGKKDKKKRKKREEKSQKVRVSGYEGMRECGTQKMIEGERIKDERLGGSDRV